MTTKIDYKCDLECYRVKRDTPQVDRARSPVPHDRGSRRPEHTGLRRGDHDAVSVAYKLKFASKNALDHDYVVMPLEGCGGPTTWSPSPTPATRHSGTGLS